MNNQLNNKIVSLRKELGVALNEWYDQRTTYIPEIVSKYLSLFGFIENEIQASVRAAAIIDFRLKLVQNILKQGKLVNKHNAFIEEMIVRYTQRFDTIMARSPFRHCTFYNFMALHYAFTFDFYNTAEDDLSTMYRNIVKKLHPDVVGNDPNFRQIWDGVQYCYNNNETLYLRFYSDLLDDEYNNSIENADIQELQKVVAKIEDNIAHLNNEKLKLSKTEPFCFSDKLGDEAWVTEQKKQLRLDILGYKKKISQSERQLRELLANSE